MYWRRSADSCGPRHRTIRPSSTCHQATLRPALRRRWSSRCESVSCSHASARSAMASIGSTPRSAATLPDRDGVDEAACTSALGDHAESRSMLPHSPRTSAGPRHATPRCGAISTCLVGRQFEDVVERRHVGEGERIAQLHLHDDRLARDLRVDTDPPLLCTARDEVGCVRRVHPFV